MSEEFAPTPPAQEEPVAIIKVMNSFGLDVYEAELTDAGVNLPEGTKLYTRSDNSALRKAAEEVSSGLALWAGMNNTVPEWLREKLYVYAENLRAALEGK